MQRHDMTRAADSRLEKEQQLRRDLRSVLRKVLRLDATVARRLGIHGTDLASLELLETADEPVTPTMLSDYLGISTGSATAAIDRLERAGFVRRVPHSHDRRGDGRRGHNCGFWGCFGLTQDNAMFADFGFDPALNFALGNPVQHFRVGRRGFRAEVSVICRQITEIFRNRLHRVERVVKPLQGTGECPVGDREDFTGSDHRMLAFYKTTLLLYPLADQFRGQIGVI